MAKDASFDITTSVDLQEVDNAINQASKEIAQRYDFKDAKLATVEFKRAEGLVKISTDTDRDFIMDANQSKEYGIIDDIIESRQIAETAAASAGKR